MKSHSGFVDSGPQHGNCRHHGNIACVWGLPTAFLAGGAAAAGIALVGCVGNLSGFAAPFAIGAIMDATKSIDGGLYLMADLLVVGALLALCARRSEDQKQPSSV